MIEISDEDFHKVVSAAIDKIPSKYQRHLQNVAFIVESEPTQQQRQNLGLKRFQTLFGLYEGVPLPSRGGTTKLLPDKITIFKQPIEYASADLGQLKEIVRNTLWHEVAHYFGLDHLRIDELEAKRSDKKAVD